MMNVAMTPAEKTMLDFIVDYERRHRRMPTTRDICTGLGFRSTNAVADTLKRLQRHGLIARPGTALSRGLRVLAPGEECPYCDGTGRRPQC